MNKQIIIAISIFLTIAVVGAGAYYFSVKQKANNADNTTSQSASQQKETGVDVWPQVKKLNCEDIKDAKEKENCQAGVANLLNSENSSACESLVDEADKNACRQTYIIKEAAGSGDLNKCIEITDKALSENCSAQASFSLAIQKKDKKYCENIINKADNENCLKVLAGMGVK